MNSEVNLPKNEGGASAFMADDSQVVVPPSIGGQKTK